MSPRGSSSSTRSTSNAPYSRRPVGQPKSSRQQFSACGACRMRRVRCDLKDLPNGAQSPSTTCSNCKERGLKCVDEFAEVKAVKLLRRGRRLQQVEAIYGKVSDREQNSGPSSSISPHPETIPQLHPDFFTSPFWHNFCAQRSFLDPHEYSTRYLAHTRNINPLDQEGRLIAMLLVVWAASFGLDERGVEDNNGLNLDQGPPSSLSPDPLNANLKTSTSTARNSRRHGLPGSENLSRNLKINDEARRDRRERVNAMVKEVLNFIDVYGIMRKPTWDGVKVLLLVWPLTEETDDLARSTLYMSGLSQIQLLCAASPPAEDELRTRIYLYAHMHEGITAGLKGSRLVLNDDDINQLPSTLLSPVYSPGLNSGLPTPTSPTFPPGSYDHERHIPHHPHHLSHGQSQGYLPQLPQLVGIPVRLSTVCRKLHEVLTGPKATRLLATGTHFDHKTMHDIWDGLDRCWNEFDALKRGHEGDEVVDRFSSGWKIFIFECHNIIREALKQHSHPTHSPFYASGLPSSRPSASHPIHQLHERAKSKCSHLLPTILNIMRAHLYGRDRQSSGLFAWDSGLIGDGCFFAGYLSANGELDSQDHSVFKQEDVEGSRIDSQEAVNLCLSAFQEMRWAFSKSEERQENIKMVWNSYQTKQQHGQQGHYHGPGQVFHPEIHLESSGYDHPSPAYDPYSYNPKTHHPSYTSFPLGDIADRPVLPPLNLGLSPRHTMIDSAPNTANSTDGNGGWSYTPPGTGTSGSTSNAGLSSRGSPIFLGLPGPGAHGLKPEGGGLYHHPVSDFDQFSYSVPSPGAVAVNGTSYHHHHPPPPPPHPQTLIHGIPGSDYLEPNAAYSPTGPLMGHSGVPEDATGCPQFDAYFH